MEHDDVRPQANDGARPPVRQQYSAGFVKTTAETEAEKERVRAERSAAVLKVSDDDTQVKIYAEYAVNANVDDRGVQTRRGLGASDGQATAAAPVTRPGHKRINFVSAGGRPAETPALGGVAMGAQLPAQHAAGVLPPGWCMGTDPASGRSYYANPSTGATQWHPPPAASNAPPAPTLPAAEPSLPPGWSAATDPSTGRIYYANPQTGQTQWTPPVPAPNFGPPHSAQGHPAAAPTTNAVSAARAATFGVRVRGLPPSLTDPDVKELFAACGRITHMTLDRAASLNSSEPKSARLNFDARASAELAVKQMDGTKLRSHTIHVTLLAGDQGQDVHDGAGRSSVRSKPY